MRKLLVAAMALDVLVCAGLAQGKAAEIDPQQPEQTATKTLGKSRSQCAPVSRGKKGKTKLPRLYGTVQTLDPEESILQAKDRKGKTWEIVIAEDTELTKGGDYRLIGFDEIVVGDRIHFIQAGEIAHCVHVNVYVRKSGKRVKKPVPPVQEAAEEQAPDIFQEPQGETPDEETEFSDPGSADEEMETGDFQPTGDEDEQQEPHEESFE